MEPYFQAKWLLLLLMMATSVCATQATSVVKTKYRKLESGRNITGTVLEHVTTRSKLQCSDR